MHKLYTRRAILKKLLAATGGVIISGFGDYPVFSTPNTRSDLTGSGFIIEGFGREETYSIKKLTKLLFNAAGGISNFIKKGDIVLLKPNLSWARSPHLGATTNPELISSVVELCREAGAKKVRIADNTIHDARRCFAVTGAGAVSQKVGADLVFPRSSLMKNTKINGRRLENWPVFVPFMEADKIINIPIAKHHSLTGLTIGMKNWIGAVGGRRDVLHQDIHQAVVDLATYFKPTLILIDAGRILVRNGPSGGSPSDVSVTRKLILSDDQVAADALASTLFGFKPEEIEYIKLAEEQGLGNMDFSRLTFKRVVM